MNLDNFAQNVAGSLANRARRGGLILVRLASDDPPLFRRFGSTRPVDGVDGRLITEFPGLWRHVGTLRSILAKPIATAWNEQVTVVKRMNSRWHQVALAYDALVAASLASQLASAVGAQTDIAQPVQVDPGDAWTIAETAATSNAIERDIRLLQMSLVAPALQHSASETPGDNAATWAMLNHEETDGEDAKTAVIWFTDDGTRVSQDSMEDVVKRNLSESFHRLIPRWDDITNKTKRLNEGASLPLHAVDRLEACAPRLNEAVTKALASRETVGVWLFSYRDVRGRETEVMAFVRPQPPDVHLCVRQAVSEFAMGSKAGEYFYFSPSQAQARVVINAMTRNACLSLKRPEMCVPAGYPHFRHRYTSDLHHDVFSASSFIGERPRPAISAVSEQPREEFPGWWRNLWRKTMPYHGYRRFCISRGKGAAGSFERTLREEFPMAGSCPTYPRFVNRILRQGEQLLKHAHEYNDHETPMADWDKMLHSIEPDQARTWLKHQVFPYAP